MLTLYEISEKYRIQLRKLRRMQKDGVLRCEGSGDPIADDIRSFLAAGMHLSVKQLVALVEKPALILELGNRQEEARSYVEALERPDPAPDDLWPCISGAASNDVESIDRLVRWTKDTLPEGRKVSYHWLAVRLALAVPDNMRKHEFPRLNTAFLKLRQSPAFAGWFSIEQQGKRRVTRYHKPEGFDL